MKSPHPNRRHFLYLYRNILRWRKQLTVWVAGVLIGVMAFIFSKGSDVSHTIFSHIYQHSPFWSLLITPGGLALGIWIMHRYFPYAIGGGIPQTIATLGTNRRAMRERLLNLKVVVGKMILTLLGIGSGATFGYEGPIVQVGSAIQYSLSRSVARQSEGAARSLILAGGAAGVAAAFNAPLAGIIFAIEELGRSFDLRASSTILFSVILAGLTSIALLGNYSYFGVASVNVTLSSAWIAIPMCGILGGLLGGMVCRIMVQLSAALPFGLNDWRQRFPIRFAAGCGVVIAIIGIVSGGITFGTGYYQAKEIITGAHGDVGLQSYGFFKLITLLVSFMSNLPGGSFAPSLAVGAGFGLNMTLLLPFLPHALVVLLGTVAFFSGMTRAPMTGFIIVMEMTNTPMMVIPLMATAVIAASVSRLISRHALYDSQVHLFMMNWKKGSREN